jgi:hypothetical protein
MKDPERLKDIADGFERSVLLASDGTRPPPGAKDAVLANVLAMAAGATALVAVSTAAASTAAASTAAASTASSGAVTSGAATGVTTGSSVAAGSAAAIGKAALIKWLVIGGIGLSAAGGVILVAQSSADAPPPVDTHAAPPANVDGTRDVPVLSDVDRAGDGVLPEVVPPEAMPPEAVPREEGASPSPHPVRSVAPVAPRAPRHAATSVGTAPAAPAPVASGLLEESAALGEARSLLRSGDAEGALRALREMDQTFPGGTLAQERTVLTVEALAATGRAKEASAIAKKFIAAHPTSPLAGRLAPYAGP